MPAFSTVKYEDRNGEIHRIKVATNRVASCGPEPTGDVSTEILAKSSKTDREHGIRPRCLNLRRVVGTAPDDFFKYSKLPILTPAFFTTPGLEVGLTISVNGITWTIIGKVDEDY